MDPRVFHQWPNQIRIVGGRAVPGLVVKATPPVPGAPSVPTPKPIATEPKSPTKAPSIPKPAIATPEQAGTFAPVPAGAKAPKPTTTLPTHRGPEAFKMPSVGLPAGMPPVKAPSPPTKPPGPPHGPPGGPSTKPPAPPKPPGPDVRGTKMAKLKKEIAGLKQRREVAATPMGPAPLLHFATGYQIGLTAGQPEGPAAASGMLAHKLMGGVHGMMQTQDSDRDRMMREGISQRAEMLRTMRMEGTGGVTQSALRRSIPLVIGIK